MATELAKAYNPREAQEKWLAFWDQQGYFHSRPEASKQPFTIVIPPPNVTGALHIGHALNNTLQDVLIRWRRMQGYNALWMPGTDHAGIATQAVVERLIAQQEKKTRHDLGREALVQRIWDWKDKYEARILGQLKQLGCSCDWQRTRFTLDPICARAVRETFFKMFKDGLIVRGKRLVNWDPALQTAVADDEIFHETVKGAFYTFKYPVKGEPGASAPGLSAPKNDSDAATEPGAHAPGSPGEFIRFSTTRPETMLGDSAVAVHPDDPRYQHLIGKFVTIPLVNRDIPIIADPILVDPTLGTGAVKVTPAHDFNDYQCGQRNKLEMINILNPDGTINQNGGTYAGLDRTKAREEVTKAMDALGLFEGKEDRDIELAHSDRSKSPIEPYLSDQWFVKMGDRGEPGASALGLPEMTTKPRADAPGSPKRGGLAQLAMDAVNNGQVKFFPERYANTYLDWLAEKRDWCISRQLWWGHRIPVWHKSKMFSEASERFPELNTILSKMKEWEHAGRIAYGRRERLAGEAWDPQLAHDFICVHDPNDREVIELIELGGLFQQDPDVLDTWFSSALWPHSTLGWPEQTAELKYYYPTSVLVTNRDIITLWVARMVLTGLYNTGQVPFHHVYIHPKMLDGFGEGMSKSKGNGVDPLDIIERYGTDALRYGMVHLATENQDSRLPVSNVCPHCDALVPVKQEHMYLRTKKITCPACKKAFRPGGPWPNDDPDLKTARQASDRFEVGRNFANKIWNAARFLLMNLEGYEPQAVQVEQLPMEDRWILSRLASTTEQATASLEGYHFSDVARTLYDFTWSEFCDWYVEMAKSRLRTDSPLSHSGSPLPPGGEGRKAVQRVLAGALDGILRLVQPIMPFVAESIWQALNEAAFERGLPGPEPATESVVIAAWPQYPASWKDLAIEIRFARMQELVRAVREVRNRYNVDPKTSLDAHVKCAAAVADDFTALGSFIKQLAGVGQLSCGPEVQKPAQAASHVEKDFELYVSLAGLIDVASEVKRLEKQIAEKKKHLQTAQTKLANDSFVKSAPAAVVQQQRDQAAELEKQIATLEGNLRELDPAR